MTITHQVEQSRKKYYYFWLVSVITSLFQIEGVQVVSTAVGPAAAVLMFIADGTCGEYQIETVLLIKPCYIYINNVFKSALTNARMNACTYLLT